MKLIKITNEHYVVIDDSEIKDNDWVADFRLDGRILMSKWNEEDHEDGLFFDVKKITHSTKPFGGNAIAISLHEVKELIGEVDVNVKAHKYSTNYRCPATNDQEYCKHDIVSGYNNGYNQALEDNKEKKYTEEDILNAFREGTNAGALHERLCDYDTGDFEDAEQYSDSYEESFIQSLQQPKTEWEVEIVDNKINIKS